MSIRLRFKIESITSFLSGVFLKPAADGLIGEYCPCEARTIRLSPCYSSDPAEDNQEILGDSHQAKVEITTINLEAADCFKIGQEYFIDVTRCVPEAEDRGPELVR